MVAFSAEGSGVVADISIYCSGDFRGGVMIGNFFRKIVAFPDGISAFILDENGPGAVFFQRLAALFGQTQSPSEAVQRTQLAA